MDNAPWTGPDLWGSSCCWGWEWGKEHYSDVSMDTVHKDKTIYKMYMIFILYIYLFQNNFIFNERCYDRIFIRKNKVLLKQEKNEF